MRVSSYFFIVLAILFGFLTGCTLVGPPSEREFSDIRNRSVSLVLIRFTGQDVDGSTLKGILFALGRRENPGGPVRFQRDILGFVMHRQHRVAQPAGLHNKYLSDETKQQGWIYVLLPPGVHYLAVQPPRRTDYGTYSERFTSAPRWKIEIPQNAPLLYAGTLDLRAGVIRKFLFGNKAIVAFDGVRSKVLNEEALAIEIAEKHLPQLGIPRTVLMDPQ